MSLHFRSFCDAIGSEEPRKRLAVLASGHIPPLDEIVRETLDWLDTHPGPVSRAGAGGRPERDGTN
jgi:hypothetical protein